MQMAPPHCGSYITHVRKDCRVKVLFHLPGAPLMPPPTESPSEDEEEVSGLFERRAAIYM